MTLPPFKAIGHGSESTPEWPLHDEHDIGILALTHNASTPVTPPHGWRIREVIKPRWWWRLWSWITRRPVLYTTILRKDAWMKTLLEKQRIPPEMKP